MKPQEIKAAREKLGATQQELADLLKVSRNTVARWERGERIPSGDMLALALRALEIERLKKSTRKNLDRAEQTLQRIKTSR